MELFHVLVYSEDEVLFSLPRGASWIEGDLSPHELTQATPQRRNRLPSLYKSGGDWAHHLLCQIRKSG